MKTKTARKTNRQQPPLECYYDKHDFFQIGENNNFVTASGTLRPAKEPRFICRACGKVIQL